MTWNQELLDRWVRALEEGQVVAAPAEGVYGYCVDPNNENALKRLAEKKGRSLDKGFIVLVRNFAEMKEWTRVITEDDKEVIYHSWPGATTIVFLAKSSASPLVTGGRDTIALRMPSEPYMLEYLDAWGGPLISTSLNIAGEPPVTDAAKVPENVISLRIHEKLSGKASKIYDSINHTWIRR